MPSRRRLSKEELAHARALSRERAARWRERHAAHVGGLEASAAVAAIDAAIVDALVEEHLRLRSVTGDRDAPLPLRDVVRAARERLRADGMAEREAHAAVRSRLHAASLALPTETLRAA